MSTSEPKGYFTKPWQGSEAPATDPDPVDPAPDAPVATSDPVDGPTPEELEASLERAAAIRRKAEADALAQEAKRQATRDEVAKAQQEQAQRDWEAGRARADKAHKDYLASLTDKYWSSR